jgi:hypothetical protein
MNNREEITDCIFLNYEDLRNELVIKYNEYKTVKKTNESIFEPDITKQFLDVVHSFITSWIVNRTMLPLEEIKLYVEDKFTFDNIERIISEDGVI